MNRRKLLSNTLKTSLVGIASLKSFETLANSCSLTAAQPEGPFYPIEDQFDKDNDLTRIGSRNLAQGEIVVLTGVVRDQQCKPIQGALVEIWQACESGKYNHPSDPNPARLDPNFQYWGKAITNEKGEYSFKTIKPGKYRASSTWVRPPHIHLKAHLRGHLELTTQVYFLEELDLNRKDRILQSLSPSEKSNVICKFEKNPNQNYRTGNFDITLKSLT